MVDKSYTGSRIRDMARQLKDYSEWLDGLYESYQRYIPYNPSGTTNNKQVSDVLQNEAPHIYYFFRLKEKVIEIVGNTCSYNNNTTVRNYSTWLFHIHCVGFKPELKDPIFDKDFKHSRLSYLDDCYLGNFNTVDEAIVWFKRIVFDVLNTGLQIELFTPDTTSKQYPYEIF